ncbi:ABC transporter permease [Edaphobacter paludis]|uniref:ABC transporter permease n=1 Tax=Edaphobacter paludis TaxID=3035702 RepID=A0AAU7D0H2_9BACT
MPLSPASPSILEVRHLRKVYELGDVSVLALQDVSFSVSAGEFLAIMGSSGSGKSTLMGILGCLDRPTSGEYRLQGCDVSHLAEPELAHLRSEWIGFVFQTFNLLPRTTALENTMLPLFYGLRSEQAPDRTTRAREALAAVGMAERLQNTPGQLSGGQQQRVAIARALIRHPTVLLADEPTGNLDTKTAHEIMDILVRMNREQGVTVILVTHDSGIAAFADRIITMRDGLIISDAQQRSAVPRDNKAPIRRQMARPAASAVSSHINTMVLGVAFQAITRNIMRSALTMLGVFIGVAALIAMVAVGRGANLAVQKQIASLGTNLMVVVPGTVTTSGVRGGFGSASTLRVNDAKAILREDSSVSQVAYLIRQSAQVQYRDQNWTTSIQGVTANYPPATNWQIAEGRSITEADENSGASVALLGQSVSQQLFGGNSNPVGARILIKGVPVQVIGLLAAKGQSTYGQDQDDIVMIPFTTAERRVLGVAAPSQSIDANWAYLPPANPFGIPPRLTGLVNQIYVQADAPSDVQSAIKQVTATLTRQHHLKPNDVPDFAVRNLSQIASTAESSSHVMALLLAIVASISLLVGGIGIMNILLVSVTERTREIGLRMAIGAQRRQVLMQFLVEAVLLSGFGGVAGIFGGSLVTQLLSSIGHWPTMLAPSSMIGGFLFSGAVGVFFGFYPARKAAALNPIDALRFE